MLFDLGGKVALITGAGQGVGAGIATMLAGQGAAVAINDLTADRAASTVQAVIAAGGQAMVAPADITDPDAVAAMMASVDSEFGGVDILVNNAGIPVSGMNMKPFADTEPREWEPFIRLNFYAVLHCTRAVLPAMIERGHGRVISVVSDAAKVGEPYQAVYAASKGAAASFTKSVAKEVGKRGVTCNCVALGTVPPPGAAGRDPAQLDRQLKFYPMRRLGTPGDVAAAVTWLASDEASWVTGQTISIDGGYTTA
jgi:NAD(P)-dependent dehydrogenase (short-subunit alcohol dehydrogenase family)